MNQMIRLTAAVNKVNVGNPADCLDEMIHMLSDIKDKNSDIIVFPKLALCSPGCGSLFQNRTLLDQCSEALTELLDHTRNLNSYVIVGLVVDDCGQSISVMAVLYKEDIIALIPTETTPSSFSENEGVGGLVSDNTIFSCGNLRFRVLSCELSTLASQASLAIQSGCDLLIIPAYEPVYAGAIDSICDAARVVSASLGCAIAIVNGGVGDSSHPYIYNGFISVYECGLPLSQKIAGYESLVQTVDLDVDIIRSQKKLGSHTTAFHSITPDAKQGFQRPVRRNPFLPVHNQQRYIQELFDLQVRSLVSRMENIGVSRLVLGVSGGVDSTAALLVSVAAMDVLGLPHSNIFGVTMPGLGTSDRTYNNAADLLECLGVTRRDIPIEKSVLQHFEDIGHSGNHDTAYENAQARERTQILLDIANMVSALVVGTGDLSEEALGFCTFAGDHIANYNVNSCITKSVLKEIIRYIAQEGQIEGISDILTDILATPVSPELLPTSEEGEIQQKTEDILGPYELHDFFMYYLVKYRMRPRKIYLYARAAFHKLEPEYILDKLKLFIGRFCAAQFKRSCAPDSASITEVNLCGVNYYIPSDLDSSLLLRDLEGLEC